MKQLLIIITFLAVAQGIGVPQGGDVRDGWVNVSACNIDFSIPTGMKRLNHKGVDSCVVVFGAGNLRLSIDYGMFGNPYKKPDPEFDEGREEFVEESLYVDGKRAQVVTYLDGKSGGQKKYVAGMYLVADEIDREGARTEISLNMEVEGTSGKEQELAKEIFRSVRFK